MLPTPPSAAIAISVDLEEYFQVGAMARAVPPACWDAMPSRIERTTQRLLEIFSGAQARATFFVVGWVAQRHPRLIASIAAAGHEIGCHSYWHRSVFDLTPWAFREDTRRAKEVIEAAAGCRLRGYRAPNFSIRASGPGAMHGALDVLAGAGFEYDSSTHPVHHPLYGAADAPRVPFCLYNGLWEFPLATVEAWHARWPMAGGAYWRLAPLGYTRAALRAALRQGIRPICYLHPWEIDPAQPRQRLSLARRIRHYAGLGGFEAKLRRMVAEFGCQPIAALYSRELRAPLTEVVA